MSDKMLIINNNIITKVGVTCYTQFIFVTADKAMRYPDVAHAIRRKPSPECVFETFAKKHL